MYIHRKRPVVHNRRKTARYRAALKAKRRSQLARKHS